MLCWWHHPSQQQQHWQQQIKYMCRWNGQSRVFTTFCKFSEENDEHQDSGFPIFRLQHSSPHISRADGKRRLSELLRDLETRLIAT